MAMNFNRVIHLKIQQKFYKTQNYPKLRIQQAAQWTQHKPGERMSRQEGIFKPKLRGENRNTGKRL